jgi:hypothetical protein
VARLDDPTLPAQLAAALAGAALARWTGPPPFVCVSLGNEPLASGANCASKWRKRRGM